jgi:hypothetical protein
MFRTFAVAVAALVASTALVGEAGAQQYPPGPGPGAPPQGYPPPYGQPPPAYGQPAPAPPPYGQGQPAPAPPPYGQGQPAPGYGPPPGYGAPGGYAPPAYGPTPPPYGAPAPYGQPPPYGQPAYGSQGYGGQNTSNRADRAGFSAAALLGFGVVGSGYGASFNLGARAGYTLPMHLYLGAELGYAVASVGIFQVQGEVGYDIGFPGAPGLVIRPYVGLGFADAFLPNPFPNCMVACPSTNDSAFLLSPGSVLTYNVTPNLFVGGDVRIPIYIGGGSTVGFDVLATVGFKL